jgi:type I restriction enzyme R subunit
MDADSSDADLQREVIELYGERYPDMALNDWRHIIEAYTPMIDDKRYSTYKSEGGDHAARTVANGCGR